MNRTYERRWLKFAKGEKMKFIGHLDLLRVFRAAIRRSKLPIAYSMGFNPHQRISFALPLPVGMDSTCEYMELMLDEPVIVNELKKALDAQLPDGLRILSVYEVSENAPRLAAALTASDYRMIFPGVEEANIHIQTMLDANEIKVMKKTKSLEKEADIRQDILDLKYDPVGAVTMQLSTGSTRNLNPMLVAKTLFSSMNISPAQHDLAITRLEMYGKKDDSNNEGQPVPLHNIAI
ncbi:MAG: TIGR03936 family radical SAM-associated protein [Defluviitaleaceae bacterium]|nr:TIGR03936 family radical SAM-associated protein [Defluviitaleaceae bacterium]